jgi:antitoxin component YwqK of YwqJK toxin-antitoxin module
MTIKSHWKTWSVPFCLAASLTAPLAADETTEPAAPAVVGSVGDDGSDPSPIPVPDAGADELPQALEPIAEDEGPATEGTSRRGAAAAADTAEVIEERYPNGTLKIAREVIQDERGNYQNHGAWKMFNEKGAVIVDGQFYEDQRRGVWNRWYAGGEVAFLRQKPFSDFTGPFISQGIFDSGDLHGAWLVYDAKGRKVCEIRFNHGEREGLATWWHPSGRKAREMNFEKGVVHGDVLEWHPDGSIASKDHYDQGRKLTTQATYYGGDVKKTAGQFLEPELQASRLDDWWKGEMATYSSKGKAIKHGRYTAWHGNGQVRMQGEYKYDMPVGTFTWYYANGQKSLEGSYDEGKQEGEWSWWHENGQRSIKGFFASGNPGGKWVWWNKEGKVAQSGDFSDEKGAIVVKAAPEMPEATKQAELPKASKAPKR